MGEGQWEVVVVVVVEGGDGKGDACPSSCLPGWLLF